MTRVLSDLLDQLVRNCDAVGVCNRLNWLLIERSVYDSFLPLALDVLASLGVAASMPPHDHPLSQEWALEPDRNATVTVLTVDGIEGALAFADEHTSGLAATIVSDDAGAAERFVDGYRGTGVFANTTTCLLDATGSSARRRWASTSTTFPAPGGRSPIATSACGSTSFGGRPEDRHARAAR